MHSVRSAVGAQLAGGGRAAGPISTLPPPAPTGPPPHPRARLWPREAGKRGRRLRLYRSLPEDRGKGRGEGYSLTHRAAQAAQDPLTWMSGGDTGSLNNDRSPQPGRRAFPRPRLSSGCPSRVPVEALGVHPLAHSHHGCFSPSPQQRSPLLQPTSFGARGARRGCLAPCRSMATGWAGNHPLSSLGH